MQNRSWKAAAAGPAVILILFLLTVVSLSLAGYRSRNFVADRSVKTVTSPSEALALWKGLNLHGRIVVYFDRHFNLDNNLHQSLNIRFAVLDRTLPEATDQNFLSLAFYLNIFRMAYHVVPDNAWPGVSNTLSRFPFIAYDGRRFRLTIEGVPVIVTKIADLPRFSEKIVVYLNSTYYRDYSEARLSPFLADETFADVVIIRKD